MSEGRFSGLIWFFVTKAATTSVVIHRKSGISSVIEGS